MIPYIPFPIVHPPRREQQISLGWTEPRKPTKAERRLERWHQIRFERKAFKTTLLAMLTFIFSISYCEYKDCQFYKQLYSRPDIKTHYNCFTGELTFPR